MTIYLLIALVFIVGLAVDAAIGGGGGFLIVPVLILAGLDPVTAVASLGVAYLGGLGGGALKLRKTDHFILRKKYIPFFIAAALGGIAGIHIAIQIDPEILKKAIAISLLVMLVVWIRSNGTKTKRIVALHPVVYLIIFFLIGAYYSFAGSGGGLLMTFAFFSLMQTTKLKDVLASRLMIGMGINCCFIPFAILYDRIDWIVGGIGFVSALVGGYIGVHYFVKVPEHMLRIAFSCATIVSIALMLFL